MIEADSKQMKKGILKIIVLKLISEQKKYGYEILTIMEKRSNGFFKLKEGTLYPILYKLEDERLIDSEWEMPSNRSKAKKYYSITPSGINFLKEISELWYLLAKNVDVFLGDVEYE